MNIKGVLGRDEIINRLLFSNEEGRIFICPLLDSVQFQPASVDVRLGYEFKIIKIGKMTHLDPLRDPRSVEREVKKYTDTYQLLSQDECFILHPGEFVLGSTLEYIELPPDIGARLEGRSSWGRLGILVHSTAGFIDPGFKGNITFELKNMGKIPVPMYSGIRLGQLSFFHVTGASMYKGKYQYSFGTKPSLYFKDKEFDFLRKVINAKRYDSLFDNLYNDYMNGHSSLNDRRYENIPEALIKEFYLYLAREKERESGKHLNLEDI